MPTLWTGPTDIIPLKEDNVTIPYVRHPITRRGFLKGLTALGAAASLGRGVPGLAQTAESVRIGVLLPLTGDVDGHARQMRMGIEAAVAEINDAGGVLGRRIETAYRDSETTPSVLPGHCREFVEDWGAAAVIGPWAAAGRRYAARALAKLNVPLLNATNHEGGFCNPALFSLGPTMAHDSQPLVRYLDALGAGKKYFLLGSYPSWQNSMFRHLRFTIGPLGGHVQGQALTDYGERNFRPVIRWIQESGAEVVMFCVTRHHGREFIHQARDMGLLDQVTIGWIGFNETLAEGLDADELARIVTTTPFVASDPEGGVPAFVARVRRLHGAEVPVSYMAFTHYNAVKALQAAWNQAGDVGAAAAMHNLRGLDFASPTGPVSIDAGTQHAAMPVVVARGANGGLAVAERLGTVAATPGCGI